MPEAARSRARQAPPVHRDPRFRPSVPRGWRQVRLVPKCKRVETNAGNIFAATDDQPPSYWPVVHPIVGDLLFKPTTLALASEVTRLAKRHKVAVEEAAGIIVTHLPTLLSMGFLDVVQVDEA